MLSPALRWGGVDGTELGEVIIENPTGNVSRTEAPSHRRCGGAVLRSDEMRGQETERARIKCAEQAGSLSRPADSAGFVPALMWSRVD